MSVPKQTYYPPAQTTTYPARINQTYIQPSMVLTTGMFGMIVGSTAAMGINLHKVREEEMSMSQAIADSLAKGAGAGVATAAAAAAVRAVGGTGLTNIAVLLATATGVGYLLNSMGQSTLKKAICDDTEKDIKKTKGDR